MFRDSAEVAARALAALPEKTRLLIGFEMPVVDTAIVSDDLSGNGVEPADETQSADDRPMSLVEAALDALRRKGFRRVVVGSQAVSLDDVDVAALEGKATLRVVVDRVKVGPDVLSRITDSVETAYLEGGGTAFAVEVVSATGRGRVGILIRRSDPPLQRAVRMRRLRNPVRGASAPSFFIQQPVWCLSYLPWLWEHHRA